MAIRIEIRKGMLPNERIQQLALVPFDKEEIVDLDERTKVLVQSGQDEQGNERGVVYVHVGSTDTTPLELKLYHGPDAPPQHTTYKKPLVIGPDETVVIFRMPQVDRRLRITNESGGNWPAGAVSSEPRVPTLA